MIKQEIDATVEPATTKYALLGTALGFFSAIVIVGIIAFVYLKKVEEN